MKRKENTLRLKMVPAATDLGSRQLQSGQPELVARCGGAKKVKSWAAGTEDRWWLLACCGETPLGWACSLTLNTTQEITLVKKISSKKKLLACS